MKALAWHGKNDIRCDEVPDPRIEHPRDAIIKVTACAICGSDLHIFDGVIPQMESGDIVVIGGESRLAFHGVDRIYPGTSSLLKREGRINLTLRRVNPAN